MTELIIWLFNSNGVNPLNPKGSKHQSPQEEGKLTRRDLFLAFTTDIDYK